MQEAENNLTEASGPWFLRRSEDEIRGPVSAETLREWAESAEISAGQEISLDCKSWRAVETLSELEMIWTAEVKDGSEYGPFNILAAARLVAKGILESDSVIRKHEPGPAEKSSAQDEKEEDPAVPNRIGHLEDELVELRQQLNDMKDREVEPDPVRALTSTEQSEVTREEAVVMHAPDEANPLVEERTPAVAPPRAAMHQEWRLNSSLYAWPENYPEEESGSFVIEGEDELRVMARTRRFRAHAFRWNAIASSITLGIGVTFGSLGFMLELDPMLFSGVIVALVGLAYFIVSTLLLLIGYLISRVAMQISPHKAVPVTDEESPPHGVLNITIYWFNRTFRLRQ